MTDTEIRAAALQAASRLLDPAIGYAKSPSRENVVWTARFFEQYIRTGETK